jgi:hypothetical protein
MCANDYKKIDNSERKVKLFPTVSNALLLKGDLLWRDAS